ncbi:MAG TPA: CDP-glucose 4,6-dehydratase [Candidatus Atribacteria bacterium]|uniref:CDP-glucose 4,6-dehydratase n=1 Tax=candidate division TA06 bacterium 34_109 TaxID=1635277 RepID=A0A101HZU9_UNCT6|nr:MAG: CDP-glucose 4,6-dehydratase [candidate division TA06 bacterium 34_109]HBY58152.1 CDP-glucose 4,6-dehydratase [Candidatus Atribacteria bacterium]
MINKDPLAANFQLIKDVFRNKIVLVTGHTGFKGSWLSLWLTELGANVIGYALAPFTEPNLFKVLKLDKRITSIISDIRDVKALKDVFREYRPQFVFHMAAQALVRDSYANPRYTYETNIMGTVNVFEAARSTDSVRIVLNITSDKCYENKEWIWGYRESDPLGGYDPYSSSKGCAEIITTAYRKSYFDSQKYNEYKISLSSVRAGNVIGGGDWAKDRLVPDCIRALSNDQEIKIRSPEAIRPWQHVLEPLSGYLLLAAKMYKDSQKYAGAWNFGPREEDGISVKDLVKGIIKYWGKGNWQDISQKSSNPLHESQYLKLDCSKARQILGWKPVWEINKALEHTVGWYRKFYSNSTEMGSYTEMQIKEYMKEMTGHD